MLGTAISYTETYEKSWNKIQKFVTPLNRTVARMASWQEAKPDSSENSLLKPLILHFLCQHFHDSHHNIYAYINLHTELLQGYVPLTQEGITPDIKNITVEQSF
jgi:hypothetical protein